MIRSTLCLALVLCAAQPSPAEAEETQTDESWVKSVRGSGTYQKGITAVRRLVDASYDIGALRGAAHWEDIHEYYLGLARAKGCQQGKTYATGPVQECHRVSGPEPQLTGIDYREGMAEVEKLAVGSRYPSVVRKILVVLYDYGYLQGMKHGVRVHNEDIRLAQTYYGSCMERANAAKGEPACAQGSKEWSEGLLKRIKKRIEAHGLQAEGKRK
jgi:hypothetical protein